MCRKNWTSPAEKNTIETEREMHDAHIHIIYEATLYGLILYVPLVKHEAYLTLIATTFLKIIIWKAQGVPQ